MELMAGMAPDPEVGQDVESMISDEVRTRVGKNSNVLIVANFSLLVLVAAWVGIYIQRISDLTVKVERMQSVEVLSFKIDALTQEVGRLRAELDRMNLRRSDER